MRLSLKTDLRFWLLITVLCFSSIGVIHLFISANQTPYANGWDGYYYVMQAHSYLTNGHLQSQDYSLIYPYFILISNLLGDYILAFKLGIALLSGALIASLLYFAFILSKNLWGVNLLGAYLIFSPTFNYYVIQFPKNTLGLIFFIWLLSSLHSRRYLLAGLFFLLSFVTHRMTGILGVIAISLYLVKYLNWKWILVGLAGIILLQQLSLLPGILHISDFIRLSGQFSVIPQFAPYSFARLFASSMNAWWYLDLLVITFSIGYFFWDYVKHRKYLKLEMTTGVIMPILLVIGIFPFFILESGSVGYRMLFVSSVFAPLIIAHLQINRPTSIIATSVFVIAAIFSTKTYRPELHDPPNDIYEIIVKRLEQNYQSSQYPLVIVHKSLAEMIIYKTDFDALNWAPPSNIPIDRVLRIVSNLDYVHFSKYLEEVELDQIKALSFQYYCMPESLWERFYESLHREKDEKILSQISAGRNPMENRPDYLLKGKDLDE